MASIQERMIRAAKLDPTLFEEVEADETALGQATLVIVASSVAAGIGTIHSGGLSGVVVQTIAALVSWYIWAYLTFWIGTTLLAEETTKATPGELLRSLGFAASPGLIRILGIIPGLSAIVFFIAAIWMLVAMIIAVRQALDYTSTLRAIGVCLVGWIVQAIALALVMALFSGSIAS